jgi:hypothetical protein
MVCDKKDCPMYGYFIDMSNHPDNKKVKELSGGSDNLIKIIIVGLQTIGNNVRLRQLCSSCCHFNKPDISITLIKEEAKKVLLEK